MGKAIRIIIIVALAGILGFGIFSATKTVPASEKIWDERATVGSLEAKNLFIAYSDIMCPYCVAFENAIFENEEAFEQYIADNDILFEVRISDYLYNYGANPSVGSKYSAEALYCARNEGKFWDYYKKAITTVWNDYFKDAGKNGYAALGSKEKDFWIGLGTEIGLGEKFANCVQNDETLAEANENAARSVKEANGMPTFKFNRYMAYGFDLSWGWDYVLMYFESGLKS